MDNVFSTIVELIRFWPTIWAAVCACCVFCVFCDGVIVAILQYLDAANAHVITWKHVRIDLLARCFFQSTSANILLIFVFRQGVRNVFEWWIDSCYKDYTTFTNVIKLRKPHDFHKILCALICLAGWRKFWRLLNRFVCFDLNWMKCLFSLFHSTPLSFHEINTKMNRKIDKIQFAEYICDDQIT